jgi:hypothetical protein
MEKYKDIEESILEYHRGKMIKSEAKWEKRLISGLWKKTEKDGNEHGILIGGDIRIKMDGDYMEISASEWAKSLTVIYNNPQTIFDFYHTHGEWDSPLSSADIYTFLYISNLRSMTAVTCDHIYTITRTERTPVIKLDKYDEIEDLYRKSANAHTKHSEIDEENFCYGEAFRIGLCGAIKTLARKYNFIYEEKEL